MKYMYFKYTYLLSKFTMWDYFWSSSIGIRTTKFWCTIVSFFAHLYFLTFVLWYPFQTFDHFPCCAFFFSWLVLSSSTWTGMSVLSCLICSWTWTNLLQNGLSLVIVPLHFDFSSMVLTLCPVDRFGQSIVCKVWIQLLILSEMNESITTRSHTDLF